MLKAFLLLCVLPGGKNGHAFQRRELLQRECLRSCTSIVKSVSQEVERKRKVGSYSKTLISKTDLAGAWSLGLLSAACIAVFKHRAPFP